MSAFDTTALAAAQIPPSGAIADAIKARAQIFDMGQAAEDAVLRPLSCGALPHDLRAGLAARLAAQAGDRILASHYAKTAGDRAALQNPDDDPGAQLAVIIAFADKAAQATRDIAAQDILDLQAAGIADADIVRLCELVAFVAYQIRVTAGLRLLNGSAT